MSVDRLLSGAADSDIEVKAGDVLFVPAKQLFFVTGEIKSPGRYEIESEMTLMQAISRAGGLDKFAAQKVEIHREVEGRKDVSSFDLSDIRKGEIDDPGIRAGDVIIVKRRFF
jgi:polysaccharide export outer membrane protein